jgi:flagellar hook assembly protein FlgD
MKTLFFIVVLILSGLVWGQGITFTQEPAVSVQGTKMIISFGVSASTDVEVGILDAQGKIIRHLACGVIGDQNPPSAPLVSGLSQSVEWDGTDDSGTPAQGGPFKVRVRLGLKTTFERSISTKLFKDTGSYYKFSYGPGNINTTTDMISTNHLMLENMYMHVLTFLDITVSDITDEMLMKVYRYGSGGPLTLARVNGKTGAFLGMTNTLNFATGLTEAWWWWGEQVYSWDAQIIYYLECKGHMYRFSPTGMPAPWPGTSQFFISGFPKSDMHTAGHSCGPDGSLYTLFTSPTAISDGVTRSVTKIDQNGNIAKSEFIKIAAEAQGIRLDLNGNIFVGARVKPKGLPWPSGVNLGAAKALKTAAPPASFVIYEPKWWAEEVYGSILKFGPQGGTVVPDATGNLWIRGNRHNQTRVTAKAEGLLGMYYGISHIQTHSTPPIGNGCECNIVRFDVDRFGRVFLPDGFRMSVVVVDNNLNEIMCFHNRDVTQAVIGYPHQIEVTDRALYVADQLNNFVHVFTLGAESERTVALPAGIAASLIKGYEGLLIANSPNPFKNATRISYTVPENINRKVSLAVFDINGRHIKTLINKVQKPGVHAITWAGVNKAGHKMPCGVYLFQISIGDFKMHRKVTMIQ